VGGNADDALALIRSNNLGDYFTTDAPLTTARPISYTVRNLADNSIASVSETTNYNLEQCVPESVPLAGAVYTLRYTKVKVIDLPFIDVPYPYHYLDPLDIEMRWDAKVETPLGTSTATKFNVTVLNPYAKAMKEGETYNLPNNATTDLQIHFDGTDYIRLTGMIQDADVYPTSGADDLPFYREFRYPSKPINFTESYVDAKDSWGNTVRVFFTFQKTGDL